MDNKKYIIKQHNRESQAQKKEDFQEKLMLLSSHLQNNVGQEVLNSNDIIAMCEKFSTLFNVREQMLKQQNKSYKILDIKFTVNPDEEDEIFASNEMIHNNIRRGLAYIQLDGQFILLRRGMKKFFDLRSNFITKLYEQNQNNSDQNLLEYTLKQVISDLNQNKQIIIQVYEKANGENAQISYFYQLKSWIICSKNTTILCQNQQDLIQYEEQKYQLVKNIAQEWFRILEKTKNHEHLKEILSKQTLIGEYCGNKNYQHLVNYDKISLKFFAIVDKIGNQTCTNIKYSQNIFENFGFEKVQCKSEILIQSIDQFIQEIQLLNETIKLKLIEQDGEGVVIYFLNTNYDCYSLAKLKTLDCMIDILIQDKIHRQIREALRDCIFQKGNPVKSFQSFQLNLEKIKQIDQNRKKQYIEYAKALLTEAQKYFKQSLNGDIKEIQNNLNFIVDKYYLNIKEKILNKENNVFQQLIQQGALNNDKL